MSSDTDDHRSVRPTIGIARRVLTHPLIGIERRRTALTMAYILGLITLCLVSYLEEQVVIDGVALETLTMLSDALTAVLIAVVTLTVLVVPPCYAAWNGGPALSFTLPLVPAGIGNFIASSYVLTADVAVALTVGGTAAALALVSTDVRQTGSLRSWQRNEIDDGQVLFTTVVAVIAAIGVGRFVTAVPSYMLGWYAPFAGYWLVTVGILGSYWLNRARSRWRAYG